MRKTVLITGGTKGIGRATALKLAEKNCNLVLNYHCDDESAQETLSMCEKITSQVILLKANVAIKREVEHMMLESKHRFNSIDVLINNAGINIDKPLHDLAEADWDMVINTNMKGVFLCSQIASRFMMHQKYPGIILNIGASTGIRGRIKGLNYCASKAGVIVMTKCLALELAPKVRVNCVIPGIIRTAESEKQFNLNDTESLRATEKLVPLRRIGTVEEIADLIAFMISDKARYITGQKIIVDGGEFMF